MINMHILNDFYELMIVLRKICVKICAKII